MAKRMSLPSKKRKEGEEKQEKQEEPKQNEDPKSFVGFWSWTCLLPPDRLTRFRGEWENIDTFDRGVMIVQPPFWGFPNQCRQVLPTLAIGYCLVTQESNDQATATPAPAVSDWLDISPSLPMVTVRVMAYNLTFSFLFFSLLVDESEHNRSSVLHHKIMFKPRHPHLHSQSSATEAAKFEQSRTTWLCWIVWRMHWRWSTAENEKVSKDGQGMLNWFHWKSTWCTKKIMIHPCVGVKFLYISKQLLLRDLVTAFIAQYGVDVTAPSAEWLDFLWLSIVYMYLCMLPYV